MKKVGKKVKVLIIAGAVVLVVIGAVFAMYGKSVPVQVAVAKKGSISSYVEERARTTLPHVHHISMQEDGRIAPITLKEGSPVTKGEIVAQMDTADLKTALQEAEDLIKSLMAAAQASQEQIKVGSARQEYAKWYVESVQKLYGEQVEDLKNMKEAKTDTIAADVAYNQAQFSYNAMNALVAISKLFPVYLNRRLNWATLASPVDGVVLKRYVQDERVIQAGAPLLDIGNLEQLEVTADILTEDATTVKPGDPVEIYGAAIGTEPIRGTVHRIKPEGFTKVSSLGVDEQRVAVVIAFDGDDLKKLKEAGRELGVEYRVRVRIYTETRDDTITVPRTILFRGGGGKWEAFVVRGDRARLVDVEVGITNDHEAEITSGLKEGDTVIVAPESTLTSGTRVKCTRT